MKLKARKFRVPKTRRAQSRQRCARRKKIRQNRRCPRKSK